MCREVNTEYRGRARLVAAIAMILSLNPFRGLAQCPDGCPDTLCNTLAECDFGGVPKNLCLYLGTNGCDGNYLPANHCCCWNSPILVDVDGRGYELTGPRDGVLFDIAGTGLKARVAWPAAGSTNAWLVLDRNGNGSIDDVTEMFGNRTEQPPPPAGEKRNGFLALAVFDSAAEGGNGDGVIDSGDLRFASLRLWQDLNHNGVSEPNELKSLADLGVRGIDLSYRTALRIDAFGNRFIFRSKLIPQDRAGVARWCWDVVLSALPAGSGS